jgi:flagellar biosynthesis protein FliR
MEAILELVGKQTDLTRYVMVGTLIVIRLLPITFITPFLGGKLVPNETRMTLAVGLTVLSFPYAEQAMSGILDLNPLVYIVLMFKELFMGYAIAFIATKIFYAMEISGRMLDVMRGSNMAEVQVPELQLRASPLGDFMFHILLVIFMAMNGHMIFIDGLLESFRIVPVDGWPTFVGGFENWVEEVLKYSSSLYGIAFSLVFPGLFATFMTDLIFGMLNRVAPQLNAYTMAMGIKALGAIAFLFFSMALMIDSLAGYARASLDFAIQMIKHMG